MKLLDHLFPPWRRGPPPSGWLSCDPRRLYADGGFYDDAVTLAELIATSDAADGAVTTLAEIFPRVAVSRPAPTSIQADDPGWRGEIDDEHRRLGGEFRVAPPSLLVRIRDAVVWHGAIHVRVRGRYLPLYELHRSNDRPFWPPGLADKLAVVPATLVRSDAALFVGSAGSGNYGHWLIDDVPATAAVRHMGGDAREAEVVISSLGEPWDRARATALRRIAPAGIAVEPRALDPMVPHLFPTLHYVTPVSFSPMLKNPNALAYLRSLGPVPDAFPRRRLFVNRPPGHRRRLAEEAETVDLFRLRGFEEVRPETMDVTEQWRTFAGAGVVAGLMGAAMANTVFMPPGGRVLHLAPRGWHDPYFWDLAAMAGHDYSVAYGSPVAGEEQAFTLDREALDATLARLLA